jgi:hypothetical protein
VTGNLGKEGIWMLEEVLNFPSPSKKYPFSFIPFHFIK